MRFAHFFVDRPIFASVLSIVLVLVGYVSYTRLPVAQYPEIAPPTITVRAHASLANDVGARMTLLVAGTAVGSVEVRSLTFADHAFTLSAAPASSTRVDVLFSNDGASGTEDRNLYVESLTVNGTTLFPTDPGVILDRGIGSAAFDGINVIAGRSDVRWNGALRFTAP